jgi:Uncharacterized protein conserved in bacteria (DUF2063).
MDNNYARHFAAALLDPELSVPADVTTSSGRGRTSRYNVYRNNVTVSLINALTSIFPVTQRLTGDDFFRALARNYVRSSPPSSRLLWEYGENFPEYIEKYEYAAQVPWLSDVARIERAWLNAWHAADSPVLTQFDLGSLPEDSLMDIRFSPHPSSCLLRSSWPALSIYALNRSTTQTGRFSSDVAEDVLITRPDDEVIVTLLPEGGGAFFSELLSGRTLGEAVLAAFSESAAFDLSAGLAGMIKTGVFSAIIRGATE